MGEFGPLRISTGTSEWSVGCWQDRGEVEVTGVFGTVPSGHLGGRVIGGGSSAWQIVACPSLVSSHGAVAGSVSGWETLVDWAGDGFCDGGRSWFRDGSHRLV